MVEIPQVPDGCRVIPLWRNVSGDNFRPRHEIISYTVVDDADFYALNQYRWLLSENQRTGALYAYRKESPNGRNGKTIHIDMAREILGLPRSPGHGGDEADHVDHNTLYNSRRWNLRVATRSQSQANRLKYGVCQRFKGVKKNGERYVASIKTGGLRVYFPGVETDVKAALMYNEAARLVFKEFAKLNEIPLVEMPTEECQRELQEMVLRKLENGGILNLI